MSGGALLCFFVTDVGVALLALYLACGVLRAVEIETDEGRTLRNETDESEQARELA